MSLIKLDLKDKRILKELFVNARMPYSTIGKKVGLSKEVVHYRVNRLMKIGLLTGFNTVYDVKRFGWQIYFAYLQLKNLDNNKEKSIVNMLVNHPNVAQVVKCIGNFDFIIKLFVKNISELNKIMKNIENDMDMNLKDYVVDVVENEEPIPAAYLYSPVEMKHEEKSIKKITEEIKIDQIDIKLMEQLAKKSRKSLSDIAKDLNEPREKLKYHLKKLERSQIIYKYRPDNWVGSKSLGYSWYFVLLRLKLLSNEIKNTLVSYISNLQFVTYYYELTGRHDFGFEIRMKTGDELNEVLMEIRKILGENLKRHDLSLVLKEPKYTYFPECLKQNI